MTARRRGLVIDERLDGMPAEFLECRGFGHNWTRVPPPKRRRDELARMGQLELKQVCTRCGRVKGEILDYDGETISRWAEKYPEGYLVGKPGSGRVPRGAAKVAWMAEERLI